MQCPSTTVSDKLFPQQYKRAPIPAVNKTNWFNCIHPSTYTTSSTSGAPLFIPSPSYQHYVLFFYKKGFYEETVIAGESW